MTCTLSILIPAFNEEEYLAAVLQRVTTAELPAGVEREIIVVDDGSTDGGSETVETFQRVSPVPVKLVTHPRRLGKGAAIRTALEHATGEFAVIQDADLEYNPAELAHILAPLLDGRADAVFGSRFLPSRERRVMYFWHALANRFLTTLTNVAADLNLTDMSTGYKAFRTTLARSIPLHASGFGIEAELTIKLARRKARIYEVPITYDGRTYEEGKKIRPRDAVVMLWTILRSKLSRKLYKDSGPDILDALSDAPRFNRWMADTVSPWLGDDVLEIGCGIGNLTRHLARRRRSYIASDIDPDHLARLAQALQHRPNVRSAVCDLGRTEDFGPLLGTMDSVVCLNVVEHTEDDLLSLRNIRSALKPGGRAVVLVPQGPGVYGTLDKALGHYRRYTAGELRTKAEEAGFRVERMIEFNRVTYPGWFVNGRILKKTTFSRFQLRVFDRMVWLWRRVDRFLPWPPTSLIAIAVRED